MGQFVDYRNDKEGKKAMKIEINGKMPDNATLERITQELIEKGYIQKAESARRNEKIDIVFGLVLAIGGFFFHLLFISSACFLVGAMINAIVLEFQMRKIRRFCEDNS